MRGWPTSARRWTRSRARNGVGGCSVREAIDVQARGSGTGLSALIPGAPEAGRRPPGCSRCPRDRTAQTRNSRSRFDDEALQELAASIREVGILQPIVVRRAGQGYEVVTGERRLRAAKLAGMATVPVVLRDSDDADLLREALIENIHREDLNPIELGEAFRQLLDELGLKQRSWPTASASHGHTSPTRSASSPCLSRCSNSSRTRSFRRATREALLALGDVCAITSLSLRVAAEDLSVRETEEIVRRFIEGPEPAPKRPARIRRHPTPASRRSKRSCPSSSPPECRSAWAANIQVLIEFSSADDLERIVSEIVGSGPVSPPTE